jgi:hypothetical protein
MRVYEAWPYLSLPYVLNGLCLMHAMRHGRQQSWLWLLLVMPGLGAGVYFFVEILPSLRRGGIDLTRLPGFERRRITQLQREIAETDTVDRRSELAELHLKYGQIAEALQLLEGQLDGPFRNHHHLMYLVARLRVESGRWADAERELERLDAAGTTLRRRERQLLQARIAAGTDRLAEAEAIYGELVRSDDGEEPRYRFASYLRALGRDAEADALVERMAKWMKTAGRQYRRSQRIWLDRARAEQALARKAQVTAARKTASAGAPS